jgi:hypothetical protein
MAVHFEDRLDSLIAYHTARLWPEADWRLIKAQVSVESGLKPKVVSPSGAVGLLQLMPATDRDVDGDIDGFEIEGNLDNGIRYLRAQFERFALSEVGDGGAVPNRFDDQCAHSKWANAVIDKPVSGPQDRSSWSIDSRAHPATVDCRHWAGQALLFCRSTISRIVFAISRACRIRLQPCGGW